LESTNADESGKQKSFEELIATKSQELATLKTTLEKKHTSLEGSHAATAGRGRGVLRGGQQIGQELGR